MHPSQQQKSTLRARQHLRNITSSTRSNRSRSRKLSSIHTIMIRYDAAKHLMCCCRLSLFFSLSSPCLARICAVVVACVPHLPPFHTFCVYIDLIDIQRRGFLIPFLIFPLFFFLHHRPTCPPPEHLKRSRFSLRLRADCSRLPLSYLHHLHSHRFRSTTWCLASLSWITTEMALKTSLLRVVCSRTMLWTTRLSR